MENNSSEVSLLNKNKEIIDEIHERVESAENMKESLPKLIEDLKFYFDCEAVTIFGFDPSRHQLYSTNYISDAISEIRVDVSMDNLAGYVAGTGNSVNIKNVKDEEELALYHPKLAHGSKWDKTLEFTTNSIIVVPISYNQELIGILQVINKTGDDAFSDQDFNMAKHIAPALGFVLAKFNDGRPEKNDPTQETHSESNDPQNTEQDADMHSANNQNPDKNEVSLLNKNKEIIDEIHERVQSAENMKESLPQLIEDLKFYFDCEAVTIFGFDPSRHQLFSTNYISDAISEIRVDVSIDNLAGYVAGTGTSLNIKNVKDKKELALYHPKLAHGSKWDNTLGFTTNSIIVVPISYNQELIGILEVINKLSDDAFSDQDFNMAQDIAPALGFVLTRINDDRPKKDYPTQETLSESNDPQNTEQDADMHSANSQNSDKAEEILKQKLTKFSYLIDNKLITKKILDSSIDYAKNNHTDVETVLIDSVGLKRKQLGLSLENFYNLPYYGFDKSIVLQEKIFGGLNKNFLAKNFWLPIHSDQSKVVILINDPTDLDKVQNIKHIFPRKEIQLKIGLKVDIIDFFSTILDQDGNCSTPAKSEKMSSLLNNLQEETGDAQIVTTVDDDLSDSDEINEGDSGIIRLVNKVMVDAYERGVSDIHIEPGLEKDNVLIRFRKDGECFVYEEIPFLYKNAIISRIKIMAHLDIAERRIPQDGKIKIRYGRNNVEFRVATCPTVGGNEDIVLRILAKSEQLPLDQMNFSEQNRELIHKSLAKPYGLILVVGPTGSGKTTTLHSCLGTINTPKKKIWTVEDPVEITQKGIRQVQTLEKKGLNFARALRSFLRGDPDVIMIGEMRDTETASIGLEASLTGHLVFSTLHTNSAPETITRLLDMGMNPLNFADSLLLVVAQRLVKTLCNNCYEDYHPSQEEFDTIVNEYGEEQFQKLGITYDSDLTLKKPVGCDLCDDTGYRGRTAIHELLDGTQAIKRMVVKQASAEDLRTLAIEEGMSTLKQDGIQKVFKGDCDLKQVLAVCII